MSLAHRLPGRAALAALLFFATAPAARAALPEDPSSLTRTTSFAEMEALLAALDGRGPVQVTMEGRSVGGRALYLVRLRRGESPKWRLLFYAQQHGDEISGKDALLFLARDIARQPAHLPADVELWLMPMVNPDGAEAGTRVNAAGADLNRDHLGLEQPETQALHRVVQRVRPHLAVDCHEFARDSESWTARGWSKWPDLTFDGLNNPLFGQPAVVTALQWVERARTPVEDAGHRYFRYTVGGVPPDDEQRHSAPDTDSAMNAVGAYGGLSFIAEAAARRRHEGDGPRARQRASTPISRCCAGCWRRLRSAQESSSARASGACRRSSPSTTSGPGRASSTARSRASRSSSAPPAGRSRSPPRT